MRTINFPQLDGNKGKKLIRKTIATWLKNNEVNCIVFVDGEETKERTIYALDYNLITFKTAMDYETKTLYIW